MYRWLGIASMIVTPLAAAVMLGSEVHAYLTPRVAPALALVGALGFAAAVELFGVLAGHLGVRAMRRKAWPAVVLAVGALVAYGVAGWTSLDEYGWIFLLAALVYVMVAASELMERDEQVEQAQAAEQAKNDHGLDILREKHKHVERLARIEAKTARPTRQETRQDDGMLPTDWRQLSDTQKRQVARLTPEELRDLTPGLAERTRRAWRERAEALNGHVS